jgi:hypothetical protein
MFGTDNPMFGRHHTEETKAKLRAANTGRKASPEMRRLLSEQRLGRPVHTIAFKEALAERNRARVGVFKHSEAMKRQISESVVQRMVVGDFKNRYRVQTIKGGVMRLRSLLEVRAAELLDLNPQVLYFRYETISIMYERGGKPRRTVPDFWVRYVDMPICIIEIKSAASAKRPSDIIKMQAAMTYCMERGWAYEVWTEKELWSS